MIEIRGYSYRSDVKKSGSNIYGLQGYRLQIEVMK